MTQQRIPNTQDLGKIIYDARKAQGLSQEDLAGLTGLGRRFISDAENGKSTVQVGKMLILMSALGLGLFALYQWKK